MAMSTSETGCPRQEGGFRQGRLVCALGLHVPPFPGWIHLGKDSPFLRQCSIAQQIHCSSSPGSHRAFGSRYFGHREPRRDFPSISCSHFLRPALRHPIHFHPAIRKSLRFQAQASKRPPRPRLPKGSTPNLESLRHSRSPQLDTGRVLRLRLPSVLPAPSITGHHHIQPGLIPFVARR